MRIAIAISTRNRRSSFYLLLESLADFMPPNCKVFVVDDASDVSYGNPDFIFNERAGIPSVKNKCLELCYNSGADHFFLFDDDVRVLSKDWHLPYINSPHKHLCYTFYKPLRKHDGFNVHRLANGCMLYLTREVVDTVGGFDTRFGMGKFEHVEYSRRIHNAGLTQFQFMDVSGSSELLYCMDQDQAIERSFSQREMNELLKSGHDHFNATRNSIEYLPFK